MDYIGSKTKLNEWIFNTLSEFIPKKKWNKLSFMDGCCGSGSTSKYAIQQGFKVISNDVFSFSSVIIKGFSGISLDNKIEKVIEQHINNINTIKNCRGFFFKNYSVSAGRSYFTDENAMKIDATRKYIKRIKDKNIKNYLLYISLEGMSSIMNTTGVQAAFLKKIKKRASNEFKIKNYPTHKADVQTFNMNLEELVSKNTDILYIDPPYNNRQYGPNYHLYETFIKNDNPKLSGVTGLRDWQNESKSDFCSKKTCSKTFSSIISKSNASIIMISYSSDGLLSEQESMEIFSLYGKATLYKKPQNRYRSDKEEKRKYNNDFLNEFLFVIVKY